MAVPGWGRKRTRWGGNVAQPFEQVRQGVDDRRGHGFPLLHILPPIVASRAGAGKRFRTPRNGPATAWTHARFGW